MFIVPSRKHPWKFSAALARGRVTEVCSNATMGGKWAERYTVAIWVYTFPEYE